MGNLNILIDINLNLLLENEKNEIFAHLLIDIEKNQLYDDFHGIQFAKEMENRGLIKLNNSLCSITEFGYKIAQNGGWLKYLSDKNEENQKQIIQRQLKEQIEIKLAKSNIEANSLNKKNAKQNQKNEMSNRIATWINISIGIINIALVIWQILKVK